MASCGASDEERYRKQLECDRIAAEIRTVAEAKGVQSFGACRNPALPELVDRCAALVRCNEELDDM